MKTVRTYATTLEADVGRIALAAAGIPAVVLGVDAAMEGGVAGVQLLVADDKAADAAAVLAKTSDA